MEEVVLLLVGVRGSLYGCYDVFYVDDVHTSNV